MLEEPREPALSPLPVRLRSRSVSLCMLPAEFLRTGVGGASAAAPVATLWSASLDGRRGVKDCERVWACTCVGVSAGLGGALPLREGVGGPEGDIFNVGAEGGGEDDKEGVLGNGWGESSHGVSGAREETGLPRERYSSTLSRS
jgi:hypothetical protein